MFLAGCKAGGSDKDKQAETAQTAALVRDSGSIKVPAASPLRQSLHVATAQEQLVQAPLLLPAIVEAEPSKLVKAAAPLSGRIVRLPYQLGQSVRAGDALFTLDSTDMAAAHSDAAKAQAALALAERNLQHQRELAAQEIGARRDLEQAENDFHQATSEAERARTRLVQLGSAPGAANARQYTFRSPITGQVVELAGSLGGFWNDTNASILTVADLSSVWVTASAHERDLASIFTGQPAVITLDAYDGEKIEGRVRYVGALLDPDTRSVKLRIPLDNRSGRYRPGMFAKVLLSGPPHKAVVVPTTALVQSGFNARVFVETQPWIFQPRVVKTGAQLGDQMEILDGLKAGERIVTKDGVLLND